LPAHVTGKHIATVNAKSAIDGDQRRIRLIVFRFFLSSTAREYVANRCRELAEKLALLSGKETVRAGIERNISLAALTISRSEARNRASLYAFENNNQNANQQ
jgi:hypothetical protein